MEIMKCKYKAHRFVNNMFYFIIFAIGFIAGLFFNGLVKVSAYTITTVDNQKIDEEFIFNTFSKNENFDINIYNKIFCVSTGPDAVSSYQRKTCYAFDSTYVDFSYYDYYDENIFDLIFNPGYTYNYFYFDFKIADIRLSDGPIVYFKQNYSVSSREFLVKGSSNNLYRYGIYYFGFVENDRLYNKLAPRNVLNFDEFKNIEFIFNKNLFDDDPNFKKICIEPYKSFAITRNDGLYLENDTDFLWFPYHLGDQFAKNSYNLTHDNKLVIYTSDIAYLHYNFNSKFAIDTLYSFPPTSTLFPNKGYTPKYKYYGWYAYPFSMTFTEDNSEIIFDIFSISSAPSKIHTTENGVNHGGGGHKLDEDDNIIESNITDENGLYCFYIKNEYSFQYVNLDSYGDFFGTVETPNGDYNFDTTYNKDNFNSSNSFSTVSSFISSIYGSLSVVRDFITSIFNEFPLVLKSFIISIFIILLIFLIIKMVVKK